MKSIVCLLITATLAVGSGCAKQDWIDRTLVTVDVTGTWSGVVEGSAKDISFELEQQGSTVKGLIRAGVDIAPSVGGPIRGTVAGDVFRFKSTRGDVDGELTVSGDEMTGTMSRAGTGISGFTVARSVSLRRVTPLSQPVAPR